MYILEKKILRYRKIIDTYPAIKKHTSFINPWGVRANVIQNFSLTYTELMYK